MVINYYIQIINLTKNLLLSDLYFLNEAVESTIKSRKFLKCTYVFGFYLKEKSKEMKLFEHKQSLLESNADRLHELLENETIKTILALNDDSDFDNEFKKFKILIIDLLSATNKFLGNLMTEIENGMLHLIDNKKLLSI